MHHPTDRIAHTTAFVKPAVDLWFERDCNIKRQLYTIYIFLFMVSVFVRTLRVSSCPNASSDSNHCRSEM